MDSAEPGDPMESTESVDHNDSRDERVEVMNGLCGTAVAPAAIRILPGAAAATSGGG